jgi:hypothetical protein
MKTALFAFFLSLTVASAQTLAPEQLADLQLKGYNERNINLFLQAYSDSVKVFDFPEKLLYQGKEKMRNSYAGFFKTATDLNCTVVNRIILGNTVIDQERVVIKKGQPEIEAIAIYKMAHGKIQEVYFIRKQ